MHFSRKANILSAVIGLTLAMSAPALSLDDIKLEGTAFLDEEACAKGTASPDCILSFTITGKAAKTLYDGMTVKAVKEECTGGMEKTSKSGLHCIKGDAKDYNCDFGYGFKKGKFGPSGLDC